MYSMISDSSVGERSLTAADKIEVKCQQQSTSVGSATFTKSAISTWFNKTCIMRLVILFVFAPELELKKDSTRYNIIIALAL